MTTNQPTRPKVQPLREGNDTLDLIAPQVRQLLTEPHPHQRTVDHVRGDNLVTVTDLATRFWVRVYVDDATVKLERYDRYGVCYTEAQVALAMLHHAADMGRTEFDVMVPYRAIAQLAVGML